MLKLHSFQDCVFQHPEELNADDAALLNQCLDERTEPFENTQVSEEQQVTFII